MSTCAVSEPVPDRLRHASYVVVAILLLGTVLAAAADVRLAIVPLAVLLGWSHLRSI